MKSKRLRRPDGRYLIKKKYSNPDITKFFYGKTQAECYKKMSIYEKSIEIAANTISPAVTFGEYVDIWLDSIRASVSENTMDGYESIAKNHLSRFYSTPIAELVGTVIMAYFQQELIQGLSTRTVSHHYTVMKACLQAAYNDGLINRNPLSGQKKPKAIRKRPIISLTETQVKKFLSVVDNKKHRAMLELAIASGMRRSEILGLRWQDMDFDKNTVTINQTVVKVKEVGVIIKPTTKNSSSNRTIRIDKVTMSRIKSYREQVLLQKLKAGIEYQNNHLVFPGENGAPMYPDYFTKLAAQYGRKANLPKGFTLHSLRHTHASILIHKDVHFKVIQSRLGHSTSQQTLDTYSHITPDLDYGAAELFTEIVK